MKFENLSNHPAGDACAAFTDNSLISKYNGYEYVDESEESLNDDEIANGMNGYYTIITVIHSETEEIFVGHVRCCDGFPSVCTLVEPYKRNDS